jgi:hypothetical protein
MESITRWRANARSPCSGVAQSTVSMNSRTTPIAALPDLDRLEGLLRQLYGIIGDRQLCNQLCNPSL